MLWYRLCQHEQVAGVIHYSLATPQTSAYQTSPFPIVEISFLECVCTTVVEGLHVENGEYV